jgi:elongation factor G
MSGNGGTGPRGPRCIALVGPFQSGKTTLLEGILARTGAIQRQGTVDAGSSVGDASTEARHHKMSVELSVATTTFLGDSYTFIDCPGSVEFSHDMRAALPAIDAAVVVCEADEKKIPQLQLILRELEELRIPRFLFLNKIDKADKRVRETLKLLQPASRVPLVLRQIPIWSNEIVVGFVDLALERAHIYKEHAPSEVVPLEGENVDREKEARFTMLESLADHDDELMEGVRRSGQGAARRPDLPGSDRLGDAHQRRAAVDEGVAPRGARHRRDAEAARRQACRGGGRKRAQDAAHRAWRQDVGCPDFVGAGGRRHDLHHA